jgi:hypothetical protein
MEKLLSLLDLFRKGNSVADPVLWKVGGISAMVLVPLVLALDRVATAFGFPLGISTEAASDIAAGLVALVGVVSHIVSSDKIGLPAAPQGGDGEHGRSGSDAGRSGSTGILGDSNP